MKKHINMNIIGRVHNVGFRYHTKLMADAYNIKGYVKNMIDGSVFIEAEGTEANVNTFMKWCHKGPDRAIVEDITVIEGGIKDYKDFKVTF